MAFLLRVLNRSSALRAVGSGVASGVVSGVASGVGSAIGPAAEDFGGGMVATCIQFSFKDDLRIVRNMPVPAIRVAGSNTPKWWGGRRKSNERQNATFIAWTASSSLTFQSERTCPTIQLQLG
jgi:hypothetical protein